MGTAERRMEILKSLCRRRHETVENLAIEFGVSERTIRRDIEILSLSEPIYTQTGRHGGGIYVVEGYSMDRMYMTEEEIEVLRKIFSAKEKLTTIISWADIQILNSIISLYSKPQAIKKTRKEN